MKEIGLYVHIPFCKKKCLYCDFNSYEIHDEDKYIDALCKEVANYTGKYKFKTVFFGGGTPTLIKWQNIEKILELIKPNIKEAAEITIECNPETVNEASMKKYRQLGINRLSIGLQAVQNDLLASLGRIHSFEDFLDCYTLARKQSFQNINIDLMFSLPGQDMAKWFETLKKVCGLGPEHISCYSLIVGESTPLYSLIKSGKLVIPDEDIDRKMYHLAENLLSDFGYKQYEISNFSKEGYKCEHNLIYWKNEEYLGVGAGSHSKINAKRFWNVKGVKEYIEKIDDKGNAMDGFEDIDMNEDMWETIILRLRLNEGLNISKFNEKYNKDFILLYGKTVTELIKEGLITKYNESITLTDLGRDISNYVFIKFSNF